jgi:DNA-binding transcriptional MerR regulator
MTNTEIINRDLPMIRDDAAGYTYGGESVDGFADDPRLPEAARERIARFAAALSPETLSPSQKELIARASGPSALLQELAADESELEQAWQEGLHDLLTPKQLALLRDPGLHPKLGGRTYPLSIGEVEKISGASERQLRYWEQNGLLRAFRDLDGSRLYLRSAALRAMAYAGAPKHEMATLTSALKDGPQRFVRLLAAALASSDDDDETAEAARTLLNAFSGETMVADNGTVSVGVTRRSTTRRRQKKRSTTRQRRRERSSGGAGYAAKTGRKRKTSSRSNAKAGKTTRRKATGRKTAARKTTARKSSSSTTRKTIARKRSSSTVKKKTASSAKRATARSRVTKTRSQKTSAKRASGVRRSSARRGRSSR